MSVTLKNNVSISRKIILIFLAVVIIEAMLFTICLTLTMRNIKKDSTYSMLESQMSYVSEVAKKYSLADTASLEDSNSSAIFVYEDGNYAYQESFLDYKDAKEIKEFVKTIIENPNDTFKDSFSTPSGLIYYIVHKLDNGEIIVLASAGDYLNGALFKNIVYISIIYLAIFLMGAGIIISAIQSFVSRINRICDFVDRMPENNYRNSYIDDGDDEIETLSRKIDKIRNTINKNEANREMMLQNISHDLKTPIAVIKSYAEAIGDGIEDVSQTQIIIEQSNKLEKKVRNLIEFNKLEYLYTDKFENVNMKEIVEKIVNNCKHISSIEFELDLDDSCFLGRSENLFTVVENIVDNGMRYAKQKITITLKNRVLSIHNDGEAISQEYIQNGFRPYSKGHEGKFGLGMSIVVKTLERFDLKLMVANENGGVTFKILEKNNEEGE